MTTLTTNISHIHILWSKTSVLRFMFTPMITNRVVEVAVAAAVVAVVVVVVIKLQVIHCWLSTSVEYIAGFV